MRTLHRLCRDCRKGRSQQRQGRLYYLKNTDNIFQQHICPVCNCLIMKKISEIPESLRKRGRFPVFYNLSVLLLFFISASKKYGMLKSETGLENRGFRKSVSNHLNSFYDLSIPFPARWRDERDWTLFDTNCCQFRRSLLAGEMKGIGRGGER